MRTIAATSQGKVTGITINQYQVDRAKHHNEVMGLKDYCNPVRGDFLDMPFEDASFDAAYAIEATCHAPTVRFLYILCFIIVLCIMKEIMKKKNYCAVGTSIWRGV
jgi:24-methylenesterol C-methyltransferase